MQELRQGLPDGAQALRLTIQLLVAAVLGAIIGIQRELIGKAAGLRTHMLVSVGAALFVISGAEYGMSSADLSRVIQGLATGIGFIGGGAILKLSEERQITGLTTAAGIWLTCAVGVAVGLGRWGSAVIGAVLSWIILAGIGKLEIVAEGSKAGTGNGKEKKK